MIELSHSGTCTWTTSGLPAARSAVTRSTSPASHSSSVEAWTGDAASKHTSTISARMLRRDTRMRASPRRFCAILGAMLIPTWVYTGLFYGLLACGGIAVIYYAYRPKRAPEDERLPRAEIAGSRWRGTVVRWLPRVGLLGFVAAWLLHGC